MARPKEKEIKKIMNKKQLNKKMRNLEEDNKVLYKLHYIRHLYNDKKIKESTELEDMAYQQLING